MNDNERHEQLMEVVGKLHSMHEEQLASIEQHIQHTNELIRELIEELGVLRDVQDEHRSDVQWAIQNRRPFFLHSMPKDPAAVPFEINRMKSVDVPPENDEKADSAEPATQNSERSQGELF